MSFWKCYYHVIWATCDRAALLTGSVEQLVFDVIRRKSKTLGCPVHAVNGTADHIHVAVSIPPRLAVADWVGQIKGRTAHEVRAFYPDEVVPFSWQTSYGVLTFGAKQLPLVVAYIHNQKQHHSENTLLTYLERDTE